MRWACILFPQLALDAALRRREDREAPLALVDGPAQRRMIRAANPAARALGARPGVALSAAHLVSRAFATEPYDPAQAERWQRFLAAWAYGFSAQVSLDFPRALLMEVASSFQLFGPWPRFEARLRAELDALGFRHRIVLAPNPLAARVLANAHDGLAVEAGALRDELGQLPLARAGLPPEQVESLARMGIRRLRQLLELPRDGLARRFPPGLLEHLDRLLGERPLALEGYRPPDVFEARIAFNHEVESSPALLFPLRRLTADLAAYLAGRDGGVLRFALHLEHAAGADTRVPVGLLSAEREAGMLFELARGRLEPLTLERPVRGLRLVARDLPRFVPARQDLFEERPQQSVPWEQLRERLRARLGDSAVQGLGARADHRPECAWSHAAEASSPGPGVPRPGWLLHAPRPLPGQPRLLAGPERIESGWWDGGDVRRDYYRVQTRDGREGWAYRVMGEADGPWWLQGWFS